MSLRSFPIAQIVDGKKRWPVVNFTLAEIRTLDAGSWKDAKFAGAAFPPCSR